MSRTLQITYISLGLLVSAHRLLNTPLMLSSELDYCHVDDFGYICCSQSESSVSANPNIPECSCRGASYVLLPRVLVQL